MVDIYSEFPTSTGAAEIVRFLLDHDYKHVFGLPGSQLVSVFHALSKTNITFVPTVHEAVTVAAADGYARVTGSAVCMLYMLPGTANATANVYNAARDDTPLLIIASQQLSTARVDMGAHCEGDTVTMMKPFARLSKELTKGTPVRSWLERAKRAADGPPGGPAFLSITEDVLVDPGPVPNERLSVRAKAATLDVGEVTERLRVAKRPVIFAGGEVRRYGGSEALEELCATYEIPVFVEGAFNSRLAVGPGHSHAFGSIFGAGRYEDEADVLLILGVRFISEGKPRPEPYFRNAEFIAQVGIDPAKLETTRTVDWAGAGDPGMFACDLLEALNAHPPSPELIASRRQWLAERQPMALPPGPLAKLMDGFRRVLEPIHDAMDRGWLVEESAMSGAVVLDCLTSKDGSRYASCGGASLGWGTGAAAGIALASGEPVTLLLGDGSLRFGAQGLWTIKALNLPITIVVLDNHGYASTRHYERSYVEGLGPAANGAAGFLNMDMRDLGPDPAEMVRGFGIPTRRLTPEDDLRAAVEQAWVDSANGPNCLFMPVGFEES